MKNYFKSLPSILLLGISAIGCTTDQEIGNPDHFNSSISGLSEIELLEKDLGVEFFKEDLILKDQNGENEVTLRIAAQEKNELEAYLDNVEFSISPIYSKANSSRKSTNKYGDNLNGGETENFSGIITEFVETKIREDVVGVRLNVVIKNQQENSRIAYNARTTHTSSNWPHLAKIKTFDNSLVIRYNFEVKDRWYKSWYTGYLETCKYNGVNGPINSDCQHFWEQSANMENTFWVDGPYRVRAVINYWNTGSYSVEFTY